MVFPDFHSRNFGLEEIPGSFGVSLEKPVKWAWLPKEGMEL